MIHLKFTLVIISSVLLSCTQDRTNSSETQIQSEVESKDSIQSLHKENSITKPTDSTTNEHNISDSIGNNENVKLKVQIDGKEYLKKHATDFRLGESFIFRTKDKKFDYDIRTGRFVPSGHNAGKVTID